MANTNCEVPEEHYALHACQLKAKEMKKEIDEIFVDPHFACTDCVNLQSSNRKSVVNSLLLSHSSGM